MPKDRVLVEFIVTAEMSNDEAEMEDILGGLIQAVEGFSPEAAYVNAAIVDVESIT